MLYREYYMLFTFHQKYSVFRIIGVENEALLICLGWGKSKVKGAHALFLCNG